MDTPKPTTAPDTTCKCGAPLRTYHQFGRLHGECRNKQCRRVWVTMEVAVLAALSNEDLDEMGYKDESEG